MQKSPTALNEFEQNTIELIEQMRKAGISVLINDRVNPLSTDFQAVGKDLCHIR